MNKYFSNKSVTRGSTKGNMVAFVGASSFIPNLSQRRSQICLRNNATPVLRRTRILTMMDEKDEELSVPIVPVNAEPAESPEMEMEMEIPPEPYPGYYGDMKRMGLSEAEMYAKAAKSKGQKKPGGRVGGAKSLFKPDGTPYAPWMADMPTDGDKSVIQQRKDAAAKLAVDPQSGELSGAGLTWKMLGDELVLAWATGAEENNRGFVIYRRESKAAEWVKLADFRDAPAELASIGPEGGSYSFLVRDPQPGSWMYRVSDCDMKNNVTDLAQVLVEVESAEDKNLQKIALAALLIVLALAAFAGISLDPLSSA